MSSSLWPHGLQTEHQASLSFTKSWGLLKLMNIESVMPSNHLILCHHLFLLRSIFPSIRVFSHQSALRIRWPKYWHFGFSISPSNEYSGLISFRMDWFDLLAVQRTLKSILQYHSSKVSILWCSAVFMVRFSHLYMTTRKTKKQELKSYSFQNENHSHRELIKMITWITASALCNSMKLWAMPCRATRDRQVMVESSDYTWSPGEGNGKPLQYSCLENPANSMKSQKIIVVWMYIIHLYIFNKYQNTLEILFCNLLFHLLKYNMIYLCDIK